MANTMQEAFDELVQAVADLETRVARLENPGQPAAAPPPPPPEEPAANPEQPAG